MSAIASFYIIPKQYLPQLLENAFTLLLTTEHQRYLPQLNPAGHSEALIAALTEDEILVVQVG